MDKQNVMSWKKASPFFLLMLFVTACAPATKKAFTKTALTNVAVVDVISGKVTAGQTVLIEGDKIIQVSASSDARIDENTFTIDASGKYLMPGLWDMHVHLELATKESLPFFTAYGITGVRDMGNNSLDSIKKWRSEIEQGIQAGPHIATPDPMIDGPFFVNELRVTVTTPVEARKAVDSIVALGVDFIKVHQQLSKEAYLAIADQAKKNNISFVGHKPAAVPIADVIKAGQKSIEHILSAPDLNEQSIQLLQEGDVFFTPNLLIIDKIARYNDSSLRNDNRLEQISPILKNHWKKQTEAWGENVNQTVQYMQTIMPVMLQRTEALHRAGVPLLAGTDLGIPYAFPGSSLHEELALLVKAGLTPLQALQTATINPARFFDKEQLFGSIANGKRADMVLLNANPLTDIGNAKDIHMVFSNSKIFDRKQLDAFLK